jgi:hypothetical protein
MTLTITPENVYISIIVLLMVIQIFQWKKIDSLKSEIDSIWAQIQTLTVNVAAELLKLKHPKSDEASKKEKS